MSEFNIEEKANAYDNALKKAKQLLSKCKRVSDKASMIYHAEDIESMFLELQKPEEERIREVLIELVKCNERSGYTLLNNVSTSSMIDWLEKQGQSKKTSIWKHWKNGICGNGEGKLTFLIKSGATYSLSSCLSFECDYIELSELENLMLEKQHQSYLAPKSTSQSIQEEKVDNTNKIENKQKSRSLEDLDWYIIIKD